MHQVRSPVRAGELGGLYATSRRRADRAERRGPDRRGRTRAAPAAFGRALTLRDKPDDQRERIDFSRKPSPRCPWDGAAGERRGLVLGVKARPVQPRTGLPSPNYRTQ